ncbi:MAG: hypothetical protein KDJ35_07310 [Alphaproteobacteria bacterium]|nr:hypothetical protein [Alphaproteobacteria bacterium]
MSLLNKIFGSKSQKKEIESVAEKAVVNPPMPENGLCFEIILDCPWRNGGIDLGGNFDRFTQPEVNTIFTFYAPKVDSINSDMYQIIENLRFKYKGCERYNIDDAIKDFQKIGVHFSKETLVDAKQKYNGQRFVDPKNLDNFRLMTEQVDPKNIYKVIEYYPTGPIASEMHYFNGLLEGECYEYDENGSEAELKYVRGVVIDSDQKRLDEIVEKSSEDFVYMGRPNSIDLGMLGS